MTKIDPELAIADIGNYKIAMTVPNMTVPNRDAAMRADTLVYQPACKAIVVEKCELDKKGNEQAIVSDESQENQRTEACAEALRKARARAEKISQQRVRKILLLADFPELKAVSPDVTQRSQVMHVESQAEVKTKWKKLNSIALDRNKRPLAFYAMPNEKWKSYERIASFAGVKIVGFIFPAIAVGNAILAQNYERETSQERSHSFAKSFIVLDIGARYTSIAMFADGLPCAIATIEFGAENLKQALADAFQISSDRAEQLQYSLCFSESLLNSYNELKREPHEEAIGIRRIFPRNIKLPRNTLTQRKDAQGAERILAPIYEKAMQKVIRMFDNLAPRFSKNAPVYMCGGGAAIAGIQTLTAHLLKRCVFPSLLPRVNGTTSRAPLHSISALAGLFAIGGGQRYTENKSGGNTSATQSQQFNFSQLRGESENLTKEKIIGDVKNSSKNNPKNNPENNLKNNPRVNQRVNQRVNPIVNPRVNARVSEEKAHA